MATTITLTIYYTWARGNYAYGSEIKKNKIKLKKKKKRRCRKKIIIITSTKYVKKSGWEKQKIRKHLKYTVHSK